LIEKRPIIVAGTGRCGTSLLMLLYKAIGLKTCVSTSPFNSVTNSGLDVPIEGSAYIASRTWKKYDVIKHPRFLIHIASDIESGLIRPSAVIIPLRAIPEVVRSMEAAGMTRGLDSKFLLRDICRSLAEFIIDIHIAQESMADRYKFDIMFPVFDKLRSDYEYAYEYIVRSAGSKILLKDFQLIYDDVIGMRS